ncbi:hypothetical protein EXIGLDRAFT_729844 [Exidia glandulosa HHB12029]|uniref:Translation initiation factor eIF2B subunit gamma n=1 Tax=Exidia glandulosa HHB12029 TaxID=1314781 RepID=A0A165CEY7_EXIGL|nr:hypothetical protein EXIGLDRAFT_729844 [Exidia glandulosa HHB12029]
MTRPQMNFTASSSSAAGPTEFLAVLIVGFGEELRPLTSNTVDEPSPKALLPIANKPLISFPLTWLEEAGVTDVLLLCPESHANAISNYLSSDASSSAFPTLAITTHTFPDAYRTDPSKGSCTVLKEFANKITTDFIILPCDLVPPPSLPLSALLDKFRMDTDGLILASLFHEVPSDRASLVPGDPLEDPPVVLYDPTTETLLQINDDGSDDPEGEVDVRMATLWSHPRARLTTHLSDAHVYVCRRAVLDTLSAHRFQSIRADFVPWLVEIQHRPQRRKQWQHVLGAMPRAARATLEHSTSHMLHARNVAVGGGRSEPSSRAASPLGGGVRDGETHDGSLRCAIVVHALSKGVAVRVNNLTALMDANRAALATASFTPSADTAGVDSKAQIAATGVLIGASTRIAERSTVKQSSIGAHCTIGKNVRINSSVIMDHCVIKDGAKIEGCILGARTCVGEKAQLTQCFTQPGYEVAADETLKGEKLDRLDEAWGGDEEDEEDDEDDEE